MKACHVYINEPDHAFDMGLRSEAQRSAEELGRKGFPIKVEMRYAHGDARRQLQQLQEDRALQPPPDLVVVIPADQDAVYDILCQIVDERGDVTCVFLHQELSKLVSETASYKNRLFSVAADQVEIGRLQARQFAALLPKAQGDILYVQGREHSYGTRHRTRGLLAELKHTPDVRLNGYRVYGDWSALSAKPAVESWIHLGGQLDWIKAAGAQNDDMAVALSELLLERGRRIPVIGVDGLDFGRRAVDLGRLAATVIQPLGVGHAMRVFRDLMTGDLKPEALPETRNIVLPPTSYPEIEKIERRAAHGAVEVSS